MSENIIPIYSRAPSLAQGQVSVANANKDGTTGTYVTLLTGANEGYRIHRITMTATVTTTAGMVRFFLSYGATTRMWKEVTVEAITPSASVAGWTENFTFTGEVPFILPSSWVLTASTEKAEAINILVEYSKYEAA